MRHINSPLFVALPRKTMKDKVIRLNLNVYRNLNRFTEGDVKKLYTSTMEEQLKGLTFKTPIALHFKLFKQSKRKLDRANILCIIEKYFCDALQKHNCIPDDSDEYIKSTKYTTGGIDKENPRCEITIKEV